LESRQHCAYNKTRECFLSLNVVAGEVSDVSPEEWMRKLTPRSGLGLWMTPFRGIPDPDQGLELDLVYLDELSRVIDVVESFPAQRVNPSCPLARSVLALPTQSISSTDTQAGDVLTICPAEEMTWILEHPSTREATASTEPNTFNSPLSSGGDLIRSLTTWQTSVPAPETGPTPIEAETPSEPEEEIERPKRSWLHRWLFPQPPMDEQGDSQRACVPGLAAHFWTGGAPQVHGIRNISVHGLYVVTTERWYLGTQIRITLTREDNSDQRSPLSISVQGEVIRWGNDGVGFEFIWQNSRDARRGAPLPADNADREELKQFLKSLNSGDS
jgi:hypothetical protein